MRWYDSVTNKLLILLLLPALNEQDPAESDAPEARGAALATLLICGPVGMMIFLFLQSRVFYRETRTETGFVLFSVLFFCIGSAIVTYVLPVERRIYALLKKRQIRRLTEQFKQQYPSLGTALVVVILLFFLLVGMFSIMGLPLLYQDAW